MSPSADLHTKKQNLGRSSDRIEKVAVVGAGTMGHGIAQVASQIGLEVTLHDLEPQVLAQALDSVKANLDKGVTLGKVTPKDRDRAIAGIRTTTELVEAVEAADIIIEAVPESPDLKQTLLSEVERIASPGAVLATNTSSLSITRLAEALARPDRFLGLHFFNPVHVMALVEVVLGKRTSTDTAEKGVAFAKALGKEPVVVSDSPGFATSRLGVALGLEAMRMVEQGVASAKDIDRAMELGYRHPMGPLRLTDLVGLDVRLGIAEYLHSELGTDSFDPPEILRRMVREGKLGRKSGEGFYRWGEPMNTQRRDTR